LETTHLKTHKLYRSTNKLLQNFHKLSTTCVRTTCSQLEQVWNKLLTTCNKLDDFNYQTRYKIGLLNKSDTVMIKQKCYKVVTILLYHDNTVLTRLLQLLTSCSILVDNLGQAVRTQLVDGLLACRLATRCAIFACV
jgi:hypothetical protein